MSPQTSQQSPDNSSLVPTPVTALVANPALSIDRYADSLMDELFDDIYQSLEDGSSPKSSSSEVLQPDYVSLKTIEIPSLSLPLALSPFQGLSANPGEIAGKLQKLATETTQMPEESRDRVPVSFWSSGQLMDKLLLVAAGASLLFSLFLWLFSQGKLPRFASLPDPQPAIEESARDADTQFADYVQRSLQTIDRKTASTPQAIGALPSNVVGGANLPPVAVRGDTETPPPPTPGSSGVLGRVYVPIYQQPANTNSVVVPPNASAPPAAEKQPAAPVVVHTLVGLLDLGDKSAALFEIQGNTKRIQVGQSIGSSGWILVAVANQEAVVRRNGEVRSIYVGQQI